MKSFNEGLSFYYQVIDLIDLDDYEGAVNCIKKNIDTLLNVDDIALAYLNCGFLNDKLGDNNSAINDFSKSISFEAELKNLNHRSKDISFSGRSNIRYKNEDYKGAIDDKREAKKIRLLEISCLPELNNLKIDYKNILLGTFIKNDLEPKYKTLIKISKIEKGRYDLISDYKNILLGTYANIDLEPKYSTLIKVSKIKESRYDLIADYKKVISKIRKEEVMKKLESLSESKYEFGDYKGSIKAIRRAEKYY